MIATQYKPQKADFTLIVLAMTLTCLGILMVFDASYTYLLQIHASEFKYVGQQLAAGAVGIVAMALAMYRPYWKWRDWGVFAVIISLLLLICVFVPHVGIAAKGARRWIGYGVFRIQPSEIAKLAVVLYVARICAGRFKMLSHYWSGPFPPLFVVALLALATAVEPDLGTCIVIFGAGLGALFFAGMKPKHLVATIAVVVLCGGLVMGAKAVHGHDHFQMQRLLVFMHPERDKEGAGYQVWHSMIGLGTGGLLGTGLGQGREKMYLPEAHTDFIFSILGEEGGLAATLFILLLYVGLVARGFHIAATTKDPYGALLAAGISMVFGLQTFMNIGVVTSSIPATGVPLPFMSYGGSSLVLSLFMVGILLNIAKYPEGDPAKIDQATERVSDREFELRWNKGQTLSRPEYRDTFGSGISASPAPISGKQPRG